jgi:hypothetical protein
MVRKEEMRHARSATNPSPETSAAAPKLVYQPPSWRRISKLRDRLDSFISAHRRLVFAAGLSICFIVLVAAYVRLSLAIPKDSDDAAFVLQAQDILNGNLLLHGWVLPPDSLYTVVLPLYVLGGLVMGRLAALMSIVPPVTTHFLSPFA